MTKIGGDPRALGTHPRAHRRRDRAGHRRSCCDHPETKDRVAAINAMAAAAAPTATAADAAGMGRAQAHLRIDHGAPPHRRRADLAARHLGAPLRVLLARRDRAGDHHRALRACSRSMPALATFAGALVFAVFAHPARARRLRRDLDGRLDGIGYAFTAIAHRRSRCSPIRPISACRAYQLPMINDITTDPIDPPRFEAMARLRPRGNRSTMPASTPPSSSATPIPTSSR